MPGGVGLLFVNRRIAVMLLCALLTGFGLTGRLVYVQLAKNEFYIEAGLNQRLRPIPVDARRGRIYDRNGHILVDNKSAAAVYAIPVEVQDVERTASVLSGILDRDYEFIYGRLTKRSAAEWLSKRVPDDVVQSVLEADLPGIGVVENPVRSYPSGSIAPQVLGIVGIDNQGLEGLELQYDEYLAGKRGRVLVERDASGREIPHGLHVFDEPVPGYDITVTIDRYVQELAEKLISQATSIAGARLGLLLAMEPDTGEILALAIWPTYDLNSYRDYPVENRRNVAITDMYEPGSTFKVVTTVSSFEAGIASLSRSFFDPGFIKVSGWVVHCHRRGGHGSQSFIEALENSCNVVFAQLALELGDKRFYRYIKQLGYGSKLGVDFPGEVPGKVPLPDPKVPQVTWANVGFGQGITVTPLQLLSTVCVIANGGILVWPHFVKEIVKPDGTPVKQNPPRVIRRVASARTAELTRRMMQAVVENGSGKRAQLDGYSAAGKTGTAQMVVGGRYSHSKMVASFIGFAPVQDPKVAVLVAIWEPTGSYYGGVVAAPVFASFMQEVLPYLGVEKAVDKDKDEKLVTVPDVRGQPPGVADRLISQRSLKVSHIGDGSKVMAQVPEGGAKVAVGTKVILYLDTGQRFWIQRDTTADE